jgi:hypothetical protein
MDMRQPRCVQKPVDTSIRDLSCTLTRRPRKSDQSPRRKSRAILQLCYTDGTLPLAFWSHKSACSWRLTASPAVLESMPDDTSMSRNPRQYSLQSHQVCAVLFGIEMSWQWPCCSGGPLIPRVVSHAIARLYRWPVWLL